MGDLSRLDVYASRVKEIHIDLDDETSTKATCSWTKELCLRSLCFDRSVCYFLICEVLRFELQTMIKCLSSHNSYIRS